MAGAVNIPLFDDAERVEIGTLYKRQGQQSAILRGLEIVGPKMADFVRKAQALPYQEHLLVHCWRGGMRSSSFAWLLNTSGLKALTLEGGYKAYRNHILALFEKPWKLKVLTGSTGSGKTELLLKMKEKGVQVVDLEGLAHHRGSVFGGIGYEPQPSSEQFQNHLYEAMKSFDIKKTVWIEDESIAIGQVYVPEPLWAQLRKSPLYRAELSKEARVARLINEYGQYEKKQLTEAIHKITKKLGGQHAKAGIIALENGDLALVANILLTYYDKSYQQNIMQRKHLLVYEKEFNTFEAEKMVEELLREEDRS